MTDHLSEMEIQQYVLEEGNTPAAIRAHIHACEVSRVKAANYRLIFKEVSEAALPVMEGDIAALVLAKLTVRQKRDWWLIYWMVTAALVVVVPCWFFQRSFLYVMQDMPVAVMYLVLAALLCIGGFRAVGMIMRYRRLLKNLDLS